MSEKNIKSIKLAHHFSEDRIEISHVEKPHGEYSDPVVKVDITEFGKAVGNVEIPYENIDEVINALQSAKDDYNKTPHEDIHAELDASVGGGQ
ncbi:MAG: hypothetical protein ACNI25_10210 [Halarcobacter sp.]